MHQDHLDDLITERSQLRDELTHVFTAHVRVAHDCTVQQWGGVVRGGAHTIGHHADCILDLVVQNWKHHSQFDAIELFVADDDVLWSTSCGLILGHFS